MTRPRLLPSACLALLTLAAPAAASEPAPGAVDFFEKEVRPLLVARCISCHGPEKQKGGLRLDTRAGWQAGGDRGPAVVPGKPDESPPHPGHPRQRRLRADASQGQAHRSGSGRPGALGGGRGG